MWSLVRHLSLDVALGASSMMAFCAAFLGIQIEPVYYLELFLLTFVIYGLDHLLDALQARGGAQSPRHRFFQRFFTPLSALVSIALLLFIVLIPPDIPSGLFRYALLLALLVLAYLLLLVWAYRQGEKRIPKELLIAFLYTAGVSVVPLSLVPSPGWEEILFLFRCFLLALSNLLLFSLLEWRNDLKDRFSGSLSFLGIKQGHHLLRTLLWTNFMCGLALAPVHWGDARLGYSLLLSVMNLVLMLIYYRSAYFLKKETYRVMGDGIFLLPAIWLYAETFFR